MTITAGLLSLAVALFLAWNVSRLEEPPAFSYVALTLFAALPIVLLLKDEIPKFGVETPQGRWGAYLKPHGSEPSLKPVAQDFTAAVNKVIPLEMPQQKRIEKILEETEIEHIAERVRSRMPDFVLRDIVNGGKEASGRLVTQYGHIEEFRRDMDLLRTGGLIKCERDKLNACEATGLGKNVGAVIGGQVRVCKSSADCPGSAICRDGQCVQP